MNDSRDLCSPAGILDDTPWTISRVGPWLGALWLCSIPLRLLQANFFRELNDLGSRATQYADHLGGLATGVVLSLLLAVAGRVVFVRACFISLQSGTRVGREAIRISAAQYGNALYITLFVETLFGLSMWLFAPIPVVALVSCLATVAACRASRPSLIEPIRTVARSVANLKVLAALAATYVIAFLIAFFNIGFAFALGLWVAGGAGGIDLARWGHILRTNEFGIPEESLVRWLFVAGTAMLVEPFCLASFAAYLHRAQVRETGEDLRRWFESLRRRP
ncbi:MAG: hypothetical protein HYY16_13770 [Planctomycetes bacterium]|nr:hypothetical protein [Planctomycetota bacterium]